MIVSCIVEGHGEVAALPVLMRRLSNWRTPGIAVEVPHPIRVNKDRFLNRQEEFSRYLQLASAKCIGDGWILLLLDADDECPKELASRILERAAAVNVDAAVVVVVANREFEAWFIAAAKSLNGHRGLSVSVAEMATDAEIPRDAKGWLGARMHGTYGETTDQPAFAALMDLEAAHARSRSFRKLCSAWDGQVGPHLGA